MNKIWLLLLGFLTQLGTCADGHFPRPWSTMDAVPVARVDEARHAGMVGEDQFVLVSGQSGNWQPRTLVRIGAHANERPLILPARDTACLGEALVVRGSRWWYSRCGGNGVQFVRSDAPDSPLFVADSDSARLVAREWLPFEQEEPGGVLLSVEEDERTVVARTVTPAGIPETLGRFDRGSTLWGVQRGQAVRIGADSVVLITIETASGDPLHSSIVLRVLRQGEIATSRLAFHESGWGAVAAAAGPNGDLAVVAAPSDASGVVAMVIDPAQPERAAVRHLAREAAAVPDPGLRLLAHGNRFIASWIGLPEEMIRIAEFDDRVVMPAVTVSTGIAGSVPTISLGHAPGKDPRDVTVFWTGEGGNVMLRRLPDPPSGSLIASDVLREFYGWAAARAGRALE